MKLTDMHQVYVWQVLLVVLLPCVTSSQLDGITWRRSTKTSVNGHIGLDVQLNESKALCGELLMGQPGEAGCPSNCPYRRLEPQHLCQFRCVRSDECNVTNPLSNFPDPASKQCATCLVAGCERCGGNQNTCYNCQDGFDLISGQCLVQSRHMWNTIQLVLLVVVVLLLLYLARLACRPEKNALALQAGLEFRALSQTLDKAHGNRPWPLWSTNLRKKMVSGIGVLLHFDWQFWVLVWSVAVLIVLCILAAIFPTRPSAVIYAPGDPEGFEACNKNIRFHRKAVAYMELVYSCVVFGIYIVTFLGTLWLARRHQILYHDVHSKKDFLTPNRFSVVASGLPTEAKTEGDPDGILLEERIKEALQEASGEKVVGVSVCWDFRGVEKQVFQQLEEDTEQLESSSNTRRPVDESERLAEVSKSSSIFRRECTSECTSLKAFEKRMIEGALGVGDARETLASSRGDPEKGQSPEEELRKMLTEIRPSGEAFVVFTTEKGKEEALKKSEEGLITFEGNQITLESKTCEPPTVLWKGFGTSQWEMRTRLLGGIGIVLLTILLLDVLFYAPYVVYISSYTSVSKMSSGSVVQGTLLGLFITIANQIIYQVCQVVTEWCGFRFRGPFQQTYVVLYTFAVLFNTIVDLWTVMMIAKGFSQEQALTLDIDADSAMAPEAIAFHPSLQREIYLQLFAYLFPGCLLIPFLLEPLMTTALPRLIGGWIVRSTPSISVQDAEKLLCCMPFDLSRYGDILINVMLCTMMLAYTYRDLYQIFAFMVVSLLVIYAWDHYRFLRQTTESVFASNNMDKCAMWLSMFPCAILAACLAFRLFSASDDYLKESFDILERNEFLLRGKVSLRGNSGVMGMMTAFFFGHLFLHSVCLNFVQEQGRYSKKHLEEVSDVPYEQVAQFTSCTYFSANPVHCLRSRWLKKHSPSCTYYVLGKDHLMQPNPEIGTYYDGSTQEYHPDLFLHVPTMEAVTSAVGKRISGVMSRGSPSASPRPLASDTSGPPAVPADPASESAG
mmetsp:Transcript_762/g.1835  ORF Transcript_762/g.1835 Transcript_762/m.1835 type:complete len:1013 (+) Transcript_762:44-3082(+)